MLVTITILTSFLFAVLYPLCFWINYRDPLKNKFHRFHLGLPTIVASVIAIFLCFKNIPLDQKMIILTWGILSIQITHYYWHKECPDPRVVSLVCLAGFCSIIRWQAAAISSSLTFQTISILGGLIFCAALYAMNLGHWYLNVHGLDIRHLKQSVYILGLFLAIRLLWDIVYLCSGKIIYLGESIPAFKFLSTLDGFLLNVGILFGALLPLLSLFFVHGTLKLKNTQASTGILYVILCSILIGDITYKYYFIKFHIFL